MPLAPLSTWASSYEEVFDEAFGSATAGGPDESAKAWAKWVNQNGNKIEVAPPYTTQGETKENNFSPLTFPTPGSSAISALILATAWQNWYTSIQFKPPAPVPPFLSIDTVIPSPVGVPIAFSTLYAGLIAEMTLVPPDPATAFALKGAAYASLFYSATLAAGVQISGLAPGAPPVPLVLPLVPVL